MQTDVVSTVKTELFRDRFSKRTELLNVDQEMTHLRALYEKNPYLEKATPSSVISALYDVASVGLSLNPIRQQCTIITRNRKVGNQWVTEANYMPMYKGLVKLGYETRVVSTFDVQNVYQADVFEIGMGTSPTVNHVPSREPKGTEGNPYVATYVVTFLKDAAVPQVEIIYADEMYDIRDSSDSYLGKDNKPRASSPWVKWFGEMARKAALKRAMKRWPQVESDAGERLHAAVEIDNRNESSTVDVEPIELLSEDQIIEIKDIIKELADAGDPITAEVVASAYLRESLERVPADKYEDIKLRLEKRKSVGG